MNGSVAVLRRAERALTLTVLASFAMLGPILVVMGWFRRPPWLGDALVSAVVMPTIVMAVALLFPYAFVQQGFGMRAYYADRAEKWTLPIDWSSPGWARVAAAVAATGPDLGGLQAVSTIAGKANLRVLHRSRQLPGPLGRLSDWTTRRWKPLFMVGAAAGVGAAVLNTIHWPDRPIPPALAAAVEATAVPLLVVFVVIAIPIGVWSVSTLARMNIVRAELLLVIPSQWKTAFRRDPAAAQVLLGAV